MFIMEYLVIADSSSDIYILIVFGFATSKALLDAKHTNAGVRDQRAALECMWFKWCFYGLIILTTFQK